MFKHILANAGDINWMAIFALLTFVLLFVISIIAVFFTKKGFIDKMSNLPMDDATMDSEHSH